MFGSSHISPWRRESASLVNGCRSRRHFMGLQRKQGGRVWWSCKEGWQDALQLAERFSLPITVGPVDPCPIDTCQWGMQVNGACYTGSLVLGVSKFHDTGALRVPLVPREVYVEW